MTSPGRNNETPKNRNAEPGGNVFVRLVAVLLGIVYFGASALIRYSPAFISIGSWRVYLKFFRPDLSDWIQIPLGPAILVTLLLLAGLAFLTASGRALWHGLRRDKPNRLWILGAFFLLLLSMLPPSHPAANLYLAGQELAAYVIFGSAGTVLLLCGLGSLLDPAARALQGAYRRLLGLKPATFVWLAALWVFVLTNLVSWFVFDHIPHVQDTVAQLFQAKLFAAGRLYLPSPPLPQFFDLMHVINDGRWYSQYPPGHPLLLMLGVLVRAPWIINPLLGTMTVVTIYHLGREVYDEPTARLATLLACLSPFLIFMSSEFMNHSSALLFTSLFLLFFARSVRSPQFAVRSSQSPVLSSLLAGLCLGMVVLIRPFTALLIAVPFVVAALVMLSRSPQPAFIVHRSSFRAPQSVVRWLLMLLGGALMFGVLLLYNYLTNGNAFKLGYTAEYGASHTVGLGQGAFGEVLTLPKAFLETNLDLNALNRYLFEFPIPSLLFIAVLFAFGRRRKWDFLLLSTIVMLVGGYFFYFWHSTVLFGPRWEYESFAALVLLSARGIRTMQNSGQVTKMPKGPVSSLDHLTARPLDRSVTARLFFLCFLSMFAVAVPTLVQHYRHGYDVSSTTFRTVKQAGLHHAVVFTRSMEEVGLHNSLDLNSDIVFARDLGPLNPALQTLFPDRSFYYASRDTLRELKDLRFDNSPLKQGLDSIIAFLEPTDLQGYRNLLFPVKELSNMVQPIARRAGMTVLDYRSLDAELVRGTMGLSSVVPALAIWVKNDPSLHLQVFGFMSDGHNFQVGDMRFTHVATSPNGMVSLFDIRPAP
jgi:hypothetical protein